MEPNIHISTMPGSTASNQSQSTELSPPALPECSAAGLRGRGGSSVAVQCSTSLGAREMGSDKCSSLPQQMSRTNLRLPQSFCVLICGRRCSQHE